MTGVYRFESGHVFRDEVGQGSDLMSATLAGSRRSVWMISAYREGVKFAVWNAAEHKVGEAGSGLNDTEWGAVLAGGRGLSR